MSVHIFCTCSNWIVWVVLPVEFLYILDISPLSNMSFAIFQSVVSFHFDEVQLIRFSFMDCIFGVKSQNFSPSLGPKDFML